MADRAKSGSWATYLVEHYRPGVSVDELQRSVTSVRDAVVAMQREGKAVQHVRSTIVPGDESFLCVVDAASEELVHEAYARVGIPVDRISVAISQES
jgi:nitrogen regulatory protein PII-like uncharacterized protein